MWRLGKPGWMIAPLLAVGQQAYADDRVSLDPSVVSNPFGLSPSSLDTIQYTRAEEDDWQHSSFSASLPIDRPADFQNRLRQTELSFKLRPKLPDFSREGAYGFDLFEEPQLAVSTAPAGAVDFDYSASLHDGLQYSAGVRLEHEDEQIDGTAYVSSSLLGLSYGRLGRLWYGAIDVNLEQFSPDEFGSTGAEVLSLDVTTGRRFGITGLDANSPLWMLSVQGDVDVNRWEDNEDLEASSVWSINPTLFWQQPGFKFSAQMQVPVEVETLDDGAEPDYKLRAIFEKRFK
jgi:hypothetical protein